MNLLIFYSVPEKKLSKKHSTSKASKKYLVTPEDAALHL
jgi:hypothetical protein